MQEDILIQISNKIREFRKQKNITVEALAEKADVSKGLISQIENNRSIPSLPVLMNIILSLNLDLNDFFKNINLKKQAKDKVILKRKAEYKLFEKETAKGFVYHRIMSPDLQDGPIDIVLLDLQKGASRTQMVKTEAYEYKYIIKGNVEYLIKNEKYILEEGDSIFFDGRLGHKPCNIGSTNALILIVYFFITARK
jgi:transcriptional regulator with XRE-family HTH domain